MDESVLANPLAEEIPAMIHDCKSFFLSSIDEKGLTYVSYASYAKIFLF